RIATSENSAATNRPLTTTSPGMARNRRAGQSQSVSDPEASNPSYTITAHKEGSPRGKHNPPAIPVEGDPTTLYAHPVPRTPSVDCRKKRQPFPVARGWGKNGGRCGISNGDSEGRPMTWIKVTPPEEADPGLSRYYESVYALFPPEYRAEVKAVQRPDGSAD